MWGPRNGFGGEQNDVAGREKEARRGTVGQPAPHNRPTNQNRPTGFLCKAIATPTFTENCTIGRTDTVYSLYTELRAEEKETERTVPIDINLHFDEGGGAGDGG